MISVSKVSKQYGPQILYKNASFQLNAGEKIGLVGPNGAGKTTLFKMISGEENPDTGQVAKPERVTIGYFSQNNEEMKGRSALEEVKAANPKLNLVQSRLKDHSFRRVRQSSGRLRSYGGLRYRGPRSGNFNGPWNWA